MISRNMRHMLLSLLCISILQACSNAAEDTAPQTPPPTRKSTVSPVITPDMAYASDNITVSLSCQNSNSDNCAKIYYQLNTGSGFDSPVEYTQPFIIYKNQRANVLTEVQFYAQDTDGDYTPSFKQGYVIDTLQPTVSYTLDSTGNVPVINISCEDQAPQSGVSSGCHFIYHQFQASGSTTWSALQVAQLTDTTQVSLDINATGKIRFYAEDRASLISLTQTTDVFLNPNAPNALLDFTASPDADPTVAQIHLSWNYPADTDLQQLVICRSASNSPIDENCSGADKIVDINTGATEWTSKTFVDTTVNLNTPYYYTAYLFNAAAASSPKLANAIAGDTTPPLPMELVSAENTDRQVTLHWKNPDANSGDKVMVRICRDSVSYPDTSCLSTAAEVGSADASTGLFLDNVGLNNNQDYYYSLFSVDSFGNYSTPTTVVGHPYDNIPPGAVTQLTPTPSQTSISLAWINPSDPDAVKLSLYQEQWDASNVVISSSLLFSSTIPPDTVLANIYTHTGLTLGSTYHYAIVITDSAGNDSAAVKTSATTITDTIAPSIVSSTPAQNSTGVTPSQFAAGIDVSFSEAIKVPGDGSAFYVVDAAGTNVPGSISVSGNVLHFDPTVKQVAMNTTYYAHVTPAVTDLNGLALAAETMITFSSVDGDYKAATEWLLDTNNSISGYNEVPKIGMDRLGNAIAVWEGPLSTIWAKHYDAQNGWDINAKQLNLNAQGVNYSGVSPRIAMTPNGDALIVWLQSNPSTPMVYGIPYSANNGWGQAQLIQDTSVAGYHLNVGLDPVGHAFVIWSDVDYNTVFARKITLSGTWSNDPGSTVLATNASAGANPVDLAIAPDTVGNAFAIWTDTFNVSTGLERSVFVRYYDAISNIWNTTEVMENAAGNDEEYPVIAVDGHNNAIAAWRINQNVLGARRYDFSSGSWGVIQEIPGNSNTLLNAVRPSIGMNEAGQAFIVWADSSSETYAMEYEPPGAINPEVWGTPTVIASIGSNTRTVLDNNANALVVWNDDYSGGGIYSHRHKAGTTISFLDSVSVSGISSPSFGDIQPEVAIDGFGRGMIVWSDWASIDGTNFGHISLAKAFDYHP